MGTPIKYYYDLMSQPCRTLYILLKLNKVPYEDKPVALRKGAHLSPDFKKNVNRFSKVPCIVDDGFQLSESVAILRHLARNGFISDEWYPKESKLRASVDEYLEWHHNNTRMHCTTYFRTSWLVPLLTGEKPDPTKQAKLKDNMETVLNTIEDIWLDKQKFLAGDRANVADLFAACEIEQTRLTGYNAVEGRPKIKNWMEAVKEASNPTYNEAHQIILDNEIRCQYYSSGNFCTDFKMSKPIEYFYDLMSPPSRALYILFKLNKVPFESKRVALRRGEHLTQEYKDKVNKFQKVPVINDNGFKLSESVAILRYLTSKGLLSDQWYPVDLQRRARVDEYLEWHHNNVHLACGLYFILKWRTPMMTGKPAEPHKLAKTKKLLDSTLDLIENIWLDSNKYLTSDSISVADLFAASAIEQSKITGYDPLEGRNKMKTWLDLVRNTTNPYYDEAHKYAYQNRAHAKL